MIAPTGAEVDRRTPNGRPYGGRIIDNGQWIIDNDHCSSSQQRGTIHCPLSIFNRPFARPYGVRGIIGGTEVNRSVGGVKTVALRGRWGIGGRPVGVPTGGGDEKTGVREALLFCVYLLPKILSRSMVVSGSISISPLLASYSALALSSQAKKAAKSPLNWLKKSSC